MTSREKILSIMNQNNTSGKTGFWTGHPHDDTYDIYLSKLGLSKQEDLYTYLKDDCRWVMADAYMKAPKGFGLNTKADNAPINCGMNEYCRFANAETIADIDKYDWPDVSLIDFTPVYEEIKKHPDKAVFTGMWTCFFHVVADFFGMEEYFLRMYTDPTIVNAVTDRCVDYYAAANEKFLSGLGDLADTVFYGNDLGTQLCSLISPDKFNEFVKPGLEKNINIAKKYNKKVMIHSCGAISNLIPYLIDMGVDCLHPLQAKASGMDAESLAKEFKGKISFMGGIDTQDLLIHATPQEVKDEVRRVRDLLGYNLIISPSHEAILPNVPLENVIAMSEAALE